MNKYTRTAAFGVVALGLAAVPAAPASAQDRQPEIGVGYQFSQFSDFDFSYALGFNVDVKVPLARPNLGLVGEVGMGRFTEAEFSSRLLSVAGGLRWSPAADAPISPYAQGLVGVARFIESFDGIDFSDSGLLLDIGGGAEYPLSEAWGLFGQVSFRMVFDDGASENGFRFVGGGRIGL